MLSRAAPRSVGCMSPRVGFVHTVAFLVDEFRERIRAQLPDVDAFHILDESLLQDLLRGVAEPAVHRRVANQILAAVDAGADVVVVTCSSTSPAVDVARRLTARPILKIDDPMAQRAVAAGERIGLVCTAPSTVEPSLSLIRSHAAAAGRRVAVHPLLVEGAYAALVAGDRARHDDLVVANARAAAADVEVLVLAQASLAALRDRIADELAIPVLASPDLLMAELVRRLGADGAATA